MSNKSKPSVNPEFEKIMDEVNAEGYVEVAGAVEDDQSEEPYVIGVETDPSTKDDEGMKISGADLENSVEPSHSESIEIQETNEGDLWTESMLTHLGDSDNAPLTNVLLGLSQANVSLSKGLGGASTKVAAYVTETSKLTLILNAPIELECSPKAFDPYLQEILSPDGIYNVSLMFNPTAPLEKITALSKVFGRLTPFSYEKDLKALTKSREVRESGRFVLVALLTPAVKDSIKLCNLLNPEIVDPTTKQSFVDSINPLLKPTRGFISYIESRSESSVRITHGVNYNLSMVDSPEGDGAVVLQSTVDVVKIMSEEDAQSIEAGTLSIAFESLLNSVDLEEDDFWTEEDVENIEEGYEDAACTSYYSLEVTTTAEPYSPYLSGHTASPMSLLGSDLVCVSATITSNPINQVAPYLL